jgi:diacylglycerol O-acyltransferase
LTCGTTSGSCPARHLATSTFAGAPVRAVIPIPATTGNVTVTFGVLSYAGTLRITVVSDPSRMPDVTVLTAALHEELGSAAP